MGLHEEQTSADHNGSSCESAEKPGPAAPQGSGVLAGPTPDPAAKTEKTNVPDDGGGGGEEEAVSDSDLESADHHDDADPDAEAGLERVASGPVYSVFSRGEKRWIVTMVTFASFVSPMSANIYFPALNPLAADLHVSIGLINLTLTTYMIFQGLSPTLFGDFGDVAGRRPAFLVALVIYMGANVGLALQTNYVALLVLRMLQAGGSSGTLALGYAVVADIAVSAERGKYMGIMGAGINVGPAISPVLGGILAEFLGWRAIFWFCLIFTGVLLVPYTLAVPETCRNVVGNGSVPPRGWNMTLLDYVRLRRHPPPADAPAAPRRRLQFPNPFSALAVVREKDLGMIIFYNTMLYLVFILVCATLSTQFAAIYRYNNLQIGLCYLPYGVGCCIASVAQGHILDWNYRRIARQIGFTINLRRGDDLSKFPIERARLQPLYFAVVAGVAATIGYGWVLEAETSLAGPLVLVFVIGLCITGSFSILSTLIVDLYPEKPATAIAALNLLRCLFGAGATAVVEKMIRTMGRGWCFTFWALVVVVSSPILVVVTKWGPQWREERRIRHLKQREKEAARLEE